jgi:hypothetical protein
MFGIGYVKASPTTYVLHFKDGKLRREGAGLSFVHFAPTSTVVQVPLASRGAPFVFNEMSRDFQEVTVQGQITWRVAEPKKLAALLDFTVDAKGAHRSDDPEKLEERLIHTAQVLAQGVLSKLTLREALGAAEALVAGVLGGLRASAAVAMLGVEPLGFSVLSLRPTPEMARALEAEAREALQRDADEAIHQRRNAAVEQERIIKESELQTELAVAAKQRELRERQMAADIAVEEQRAALIDRQVENERKAADSRAYALKATLEPLEKADWKTLMAIAPGGGDAKTMIALAFRELAENAGKIGELNISPDLLGKLLKG